MILSSDSLFMNTLILMRHGETDSNLKKQLSPYDTRVSPEWAQKSRTRAEQKKGQFDDFVLISNGQLRCQELYKILHEHNDFSAGIIDTRFDERKFWVLVGKTKDEVIEYLSLFYPDRYEELGDDFSRWMDQEFVDVLWRSLFESNSQLRKRVYDALIDVMDHQFPEKKLMIVTSSGVLRSLQAILLWKTTQEFDQYLKTMRGENKIPNLWYTEFVRDAESVRYQLGKFNHID